ncbi:uncharacterized protein ColSpa_04800 [Colletotrichum spaethianum]|uniref:Rta1 domain-containing protein n=1 Tax=Colletotrichum spaethianum TaxID=700344 RepID=A0AA37LC52_9PEZI|nr:uncharacterized protein ColSpa_04800 [Colletotrichum spaethianum]GKT44619.1 hypothetical protein ColSpa_04800 [Colletotrichum spaethianum]
MNAKEFRANVESGELPVDHHDRVLRIAFIYLDEGLWDGNGVFDVVDQLHARGWSFGEEGLRFNRTLDIFYLAQIAAGIYRSSNQLDGDFPLADDFDTFYAEHRQLLNLKAWREYYSPAFLAQPVSARFYRLPDLQDLPDASDPLGQPRRDKGIGHFTKLPRWAHNVARTRRRQPALPTATMTEIALSTLQQTIERLRKDRPSVVHPYSKTQARFWLKYMKMDFPGPYSSEAWNPNEFGIYVAQGPSTYGTLKSEVDWCGLPDGGVGLQAWWRGWEPEVGSEEEVAFLAAVAAKETEGVDASSNTNNLDYAMRSHLLLGLLFAAFETTERERHVEDVKRRAVEASRLDESKAEQWVRHALKVMEPYVHERGQHGRPVAAEDLNGLLQRVLAETGHIFARWKLSPTSKEYNFELKTMDEANTISMTKEYI